MKRWMMIFLVLAVVATGCAKKSEESASPSPTAGATVAPSTGASATPGATNGTGGGTSATATPAAGGNDTTKDEPLPQITKEQADKISMTSTYDDLVKQTGAKGKLVKDENGKKTYDFAISNQPGYIAEIVYFADGMISEKKVFRK